MIDEVREDNQDMLDVVIFQMLVIYNFTERKLTEIEVKYIAIHVILLNVLKIGGQIFIFSIMHYPLI